MISFPGAAEQGAGIVRLRPSTQPGTPGAAMPGCVGRADAAEGPVPSPGRVLLLPGAEGAL